MCITGVSGQDLMVLLFGFVFFALIPWRGETLGMRVAIGLVIPPLAVGLGHLMIG